MSFDDIFAMEDDIPRSAAMSIPSPRSDNRSSLSWEDKPRKVLAIPAQDMSSLSKFENQAKLELYFMNYDDWELDALTCMCVDKEGRFVHEGPVGCSPFIYKRWVAQQERAKRIKRAQDSFFNDEIYQASCFDLMPKEDEEQMDSLKQSRGRTERSRVHGSRNRNTARTPPRVSRARQLSESEDSCIDSWMEMVPQKTSVVDLHTPPPTPPPTPPRSSAPPSEVPTKVFKYEARNTREMLGKPQRVEIRPTRTFDRPIHILKIEAARTKAMIEKEWEVINQEKKAAGAKERRVHFAV